MDLSRRELFAIAAGIPFVRFFQDRTKFEGKDVFDRLLTKADLEQWKQLPIGEIVGRVGIELIATPYVGFTLEHTVDREVCTINLVGLDCVTFFESSLAFARMLKSGGRTTREMIEQVQLTRYRGGVLGDYSSRLHYTMDWFDDNVKKGTVRMLTPTLPGNVVFHSHVNWMTTHPTSYKQLHADTTLIEKIANFESELNRREHIFLPKENIAAAEPLMQTGDILGITTDGKGIDISHTGLLYKDREGIVHFLDASSIHMKVTLESRLSEFMNRSKKSTGVMIARPIWK